MGQTDDKAQTCYHIPNNSMNKIPAKRFRPSLYVRVIPVVVILVILLSFALANFVASVILTFVALLWCISVLGDWIVYFQFENDMFSASNQKKSLSQTEVAQCRYRFLVGPYVKSPRLCTFHLTDSDGARLSGWSGTFMAIPRYGWLPAERREFFTKLNSWLSNSSAQIDDETWERLRRAAR